MSLENFDIQQMEENGVFDYYNELSSWIGWFIDQNYPLTEQDFLAIMNDQETENIKLRSFVSDVMNNKKFEILDREAAKNKERLTHFQETFDYNSFQTETMQQKLISFKDEILEARFNALNEENVEEL